MVEEEVVKLGVSNIRLRNNPQETKKSAQPEQKSGFWTFSKN